MAKQINLGDKVVDRITGFSGVAIGRCEYLNGCVSFQVQPKLLNSAWQESKWVDEQNLNLESAVKSGGPHDTPPAMHP